MTLRYNLTGADRKRLVTAISGSPAPCQIPGRTQLRLPGGLLHHRPNGGVTFDDCADSEEIENLIETLDNQGFTANRKRSRTSRKNAKTVSRRSGRAVHLHACQPVLETALQNLKDITAAKGNLIRKALGVEELPIEVGETKVSFPWFAGTPAPEEVKAYDHFICALCEMARNQAHHRQGAGHRKRQSTPSAASSSDWASSARSTSRSARFSCGI